MSHPRIRAYMILYITLHTRGERYNNIYICIYNINMLFIKNARFPRRGVDVCQRVSVCDDGTCGSFRV